MRVRELTVNSKFYVVWRVAQLFALTGISKVNDIVYWLWYCSHILCGLFNLNLHWVFVLISRWKNLLKMLVVSTKQVKQQSLITLDLNCVSCFYKLLQFYCGQPQSPTHHEGASALTTATAARTSLLKWIRVFSTFVAFIPFPWKPQMMANFPGVDFLETALKFRNRKKKRSSLVYVLHKT